MSCKLFSRNEAISMQAEIFDNLRSSDARVFLLKRAGQTKKFTVVMQLVSGWFVSYDKFREAFGLRYATADTSFGDKLAQSSFIAYGLPDGDGVVDIYDISPDKRDKIPPNETNPAWKVFVQRIDEERFEIP